MERAIHRIYLLFLLVLTLVLVDGMATYRLNVQKPFQKEGLQILNAEPISCYEYKDAPAGIRMVYEINLRNTEPEYQHLVFYTIHQEVKVLSGGKCLYRMNASSEDSFGKTPGCVWNDVLLTKENKNSPIIIEVTPVYASAKSLLSRVYIGTRGAIVRKILKDELPKFLMGLLTVLTGILFIVYVIVNRTNTEINKGIAYLGFFSIAVGCWKMADGNLLKFVFPGVVALSMIPYVCLLVAPVPLIFYVREIQGGKNSIVWSLMSWLNLVTAGVCILLQATQIYDFKESFPVIILMFALSSLGLVVVTVYTGIRKGWSKKLRQNIFGLLFCISGIVLDISSYYLTGGTKTTLVGMLIFLVYIIGEGKAAIAEATELANIGRKTQNFEQMAYHDQLTGLYNRSALAYDTAVNVFDTENTAIIMLDLNDLKKCNDTLGHEKGDLYIKESANLIQDVFGEYGKCYRIGGDEFCCIMKDPDYKICKKQVELLPVRIQQYNEQHQEFHMAIACGYARFDHRIDYTAEDTMKRADERMYRDKQRQKELNQEVLGITQNKKKES